VTRRLVLLSLALLFMAFAIYGSFVPLSLRHISVGEAVWQFVRTRFDPHLSGTDFVSNVLLFIPIGFFLIGGLADRSRSLAITLLLPVVGFGVVLSIAIEFGQTFVVGRTPSWDDVLAESMGCTVGSLAWLVAGPLVVEFLAPLLHSESRTDRAFRLLGAYAALWILLGLLPFDFTLRPQEIAEKFREGRIVLEPFAGATLQDVIGTWLMAIPLGAFCVLAAIHFRAPRPIMAAVGMGIALSAGIESIQVLAMSRTADVTDFTMNSLGVITGVVIATRWLARSRDEAAFEGVRLWPLVAVLVWFLVLIGRHWSPFDFLVDASFARSRLPDMFRVPFYSYYWASPLYALTEATTKMLLGIPVGALLRLTWQPRSWGAEVAQAVGITIFAGFLFLVIELGQLLLPSRYPDQTDIYLGTFGAVLGLLAIMLLMRRDSQ
jgi:glycopeptide antibiotics resistance protein